MAPGDWNGQGFARRVATCLVVVAATGLVSGGAPASGVGTCTKPVTGLVGWWSGDGTAQAEVGPDAGVSGGLSYGVGVDGQSFAFNGSDSLLTVGSGAQLNLSGQASVETWARFEPGSSIQNLVSKFNPNNNTATNRVADDSYILLAEPGSAQLRWQLDTWTGPGTGGNNFAPDGVTDNIMWAPAGSAFDGGWHHIAATYDGATMMLYLDGNPIGSMSIDGPIVQSGTPVRIGWSPDYAAGAQPNWLLHGGMDETGVYNRALTAAEVQSLASCQPFAGLPNSPTAVAAVGGDAEATVAWEPPVNDGGSPITSQTVTATPGGATATVGAGSSSALVTGLANGVTYTFTVVATNASGDSPPSAPSNPVTPGAPPDAPTGVQASSKPGGAHVRWTPPADPGGGAVLGYTVTEVPGGATVIVPGDGTSAEFSGLTNGTPVSFTVVATNAFGDSPTSMPSGVVVPEETLLYVSDATVVEGAPGQKVRATVVVSLSQRATNLTTVDYTTVDGTATAPDDHRAKAGTLTFKPGQFQKVIGVLLTSDDIPEWPEAFTLQLQGATGAGIARGVSTVTVLDDDAQGGGPAVSCGGTTDGLTVTDATSVERDVPLAHAMKFTVRLCGPQVDVVSVQLTVVAQTTTSGIDYRTVKPRTLTFLPGQTQKALNVTVLGDDVTEGDEQFLVVLADPSNATISRGVGVGTILDDD